MEFKDPVREHKIKISKKGQGEMEEEEDAILFKIMFYAYVFSF